MQRAMVFRKTGSLTKHFGGVETGLCDVPWFSVENDGVQASICLRMTLRQAKGQVGLYSVLPNPIRPVPSAWTGGACSCRMARPWTSQYRIDVIVGKVNGSSFSERAHGFMSKKEKRCGAEILKWSYLAIFQSEECCHGSGRFAFIYVRTRHGKPQSKSSHAKR